MDVHWVSGVSSSQTLRWREAGHTQWTSQRASTTSTYSKSELRACESRSAALAHWMDPGYFHRASMTQLVPGTTYEYSAGSDADAWSPPAAFRFVARNANDLPPPSANGSDTEGVEFKAILIGDVGTFLCQNTSKLFKN